MLEKKTGLDILPLYDVEAAKTAGLANRIRAEKAHPRGDVFWSSALLQTLLLKREGLLQNYLSPNGDDIPEAFKDHDGAWTGVGLRWRVQMYRGPVRVGRVNNFLATPRKGISNPQFGTGSDWVAMLTVRWGKKKTLDYFRQFKESGGKVLPGNGVVAEQVVRNELDEGITDSDDFWASTRKEEAGKFAITPFLTSLTKGCYVPGSVTILKGAPNAENARKLIDAILEPETEQMLVKLMKGVKPLHGAKVDVPNDKDKWPAAWDEIREPLAQILLAE